MNEFTTGHPASTNIGPSSFDIRYSLFEYSETGLKISNKEYRTRNIPDGSYALPKFIL